ncbi:hypothetical protein DTO207G8_6876 [Paecilomyces variotii]|nr:hypothetical protein DTO207G8_6876 [Paecilomyces variotii]KAJ9383527.1 hypothetical protein DTO063F5_5184 [Paecilomyces variotii]
MLGRFPAEKNRVFYGDTKTIIRYALLPEENKACPAEVLVLKRGVSRNGTGRLFILIHITIGAASRLVN